MKIGLLMTRDENDILEDTLAVNCQHVDCFYALDGSEDYGTAAAICYATGKCAGFTRDAETGYENITDGCRQFIYAQAVKEHGYANWFLLLHGDEAWTFDPDAAIDADPEADGFEFRLPFLFPRSWDYDRTAFEQLTEALGPGWPEFRMFKGSPFVRYYVHRHFSVRPQGIQRAIRFDWPIMHYPFRSPEVQRHHAAKSKTWSPENLEAVRERDEVFWNDERIAAFCAGNEHYDRVVSLSGI